MDEGYSGGINYLASTVASRMRQRQRVSEYAFVSHLKSMMERYQTTMRGAMAALRPTRPLRAASGELIPPPTPTEWSKHCMHLEDCITELFEDALVKAESEAQNIAVMRLRMRSMRNCGSTAIADHLDYKISFALEEIQKQLDFSYDVFFPEFDLPPNVSIDTAEDMKTWLEPLTRERRIRLIVPYSMRFDTSVASIVVDVTNFNRTLSSRGVAWSEVQYRFHGQLRKHAIMELQFDECSASVATFDRRVALLEASSNVIASYVRLSTACSAEDERNCVEVAEVAEFALNDLLTIDPSITLEVASSIVQNLVNVSCTPTRAVEAIAACMKDLTIQHDSIGASITAWIQKHKHEIYTTIILTQVAHDLFFATKALKDGHSNVATSVIGRHMHRRLDTRGYDGGEDDARRITRWESQWTSREGRAIRPTRDPATPPTDCMQPTTSRPPTPIRTRKNDKTTKPIPRPPVKRALSPCKFGLRLPSLDSAYSRLVSLRSMTSHYDMNESRFR